MPQVVIVSSLGPQGPVGPQGLQGLTGSMAESNSGSFAITGSLTVSGSSTFTNIGPAVFSGSSNFTSLTASSALISGNVTVLGTASINTLIVNQTQLSTGSNQLGDAANDTQTLYGTVAIPTGSLTVSGSSYFSGSVGIGTANPSFILDVVGSTRTNLTSFASQFKGDGGYANANAFSFSGNGNIGMYFPSNVNLGFSTSGNERMRIDASGSIGIGTTSPSYTLDISGSLRVGTPTATPHLVFARASNNYITTPVGGALLFNLNNAAVENASIVGIYSTGLKIGTGFSSPSAVAHVRGTGATSATTALLVQNSNASASLTVLDNGYVGIGSTTPLRQLYVAGDLEVTNGIYGDSTDHTFYTIASGSYHHRFYTRTSGGTSLERFTIQGGADTGSAFFQNTNVGIGTTSPAYRLDIAGDTQIQSSYFLRFANEWGIQQTGTDLNIAEVGSADGRLYLKAGGNVGVGTTAPSAKLDVIGTGVFGSMTASRGNYSNGLSLQNNAGQATSLFLWQAGIGSGHFGFPSGSSNLYIVNSYNTGLITESNYIVLSNTGNVGIGTTAPTARLHVVGTGSTSATAAFLVRNSNLSASLVIKDDGFVGIGTVSPTGKVHITPYPSYYTLVVGRSNGYSSIKASTDDVFSTTLALDSAGGATIINHYVSDNVRLVTGGGSVGVGTNTPIARLHTTGTGTTSATTAFRVENSNTSASMAVLDNGYVGIGTAAPSYSLDVYGSYHQYQVQGQLARYDISSANANQNRGVWDFYTNVAVAPDFFGRFGFKFEGGVSDSFKQYQVHIGDSTTPKFIVDGAGRVAIGTITPAASLHISGSSGSVLFEIDSNSTQNILYVSGSGNVGIGTNSPQRRLHVDASGSVNPEAPLLLTSVNTVSNRVGILFASSSVSAGKQHYLYHRVNGPVVEWILGMGAGETGIWRFLPQDNTSYGVNILAPFSGGTTYITTGISQSLFSLGAGGQTNQHINISSSGFVGIGTTTPTANLVVSSGSAPTLKLENTANIGTTGWVGTTISSLEFSTTDPSAAGTYARISAIGGSGSAGGGLEGDLIFSTAPLNAPNSIAERVRINSIGNVGIGTTTPGSLLTVAGAVSASSFNANFAVVSTRASKADFYGFTGPTLSYYNGVSVVPALTVNSTGNITINTTTDPGAKLAIRGAGSTSATTAFRVENANASSSLTITDDLTSRFFGNVGIGALPASGSLHISGAASTSSAAVYIYKSGSTTLDIQGSQGQLFSVTDALSGSLMSVNDISGLPILEVFSDDRVVMGSFSQPALLVTGSAVRFPATASATPTYTGSEGQVVFGVVGGNAFIYAWLGGRWRSGSLA